MKTIKFLTLAFIAICMTSLFAACKKNKDNTPVTPATNNTAIQGSWSGKLTAKDKPEVDFYFTVKPGGLFEVTDKSGATPKVIEGMWLLDGTTFRAMYPDPVTGKNVFVTAAFNKDGKISGSFGDKKDDASGGSISMTKDK